MIRSVEIKNLRGIQSGKLEDLTPLTILVGPNGCGKSTILDALLLGGHPIPGQALTELADRRPATKEGPRWLFWRSKLENPVEILMETFDEEMYSSRRLRLQFVRGSTDGVKSFLVEYDEAGEEHLSEVASLGMEGGSSYTGNAQPVYGVSEISLIEPTANGKQTPLYDLLTQTIAQGRRKEAIEILSAVVPGLDNVEILTEKGAPLLYMVFPDYAVPAALAGDGIQVLLRLSLELASRPGGVVLLEEPEVHQHPGAMRQTARAIWAAVRRNIQVVLTTHSLELIDLLLTERQTEEELDKLSVFGMKLDDGCLKSFHLNGSEVALARTTIEDDLR